MSSKQKPKFSDEEIRTYRDEDCPQCNFPETIMVWEPKGMKPVRFECSNKCGWTQEIKSLKLTSGIILS